MIATSTINLVLNIYYLFDFFVAISFLLIHLNLLRFVHVNEILLIRNRKLTSIKRRELSFDKVHFKDHIISKIDFLIFCFYTLITSSFHNRISLFLRQMKI